MTAHGSSFSKKCNYVVTQESFIDCRRQQKSSISKDKLKQNDPWGTLRIEKNHWFLHVGKGFHFELFTLFFCLTILPSLEHLIDLKNQFESNCWFWQRISSQLIERDLLHTQRLVLTIKAAALMTESWNRKKKSYVIWNLECGHIIQRFISRCK